MSNFFNSRIQLKSAHSESHCAKQTHQPQLQPQLRKGYSSKPKSKFHMRLKTDSSHLYHNLSGTHYTSFTNNDKSFIPTQPSRPLSLETVKKMNLKRKQLEKEIKNMSTEHEIVEKDLFAILDNERNSPHKFRQKYNISKSLMSEKIRQDAELIFNIKFKHYDQKTYTKNLLNEAAHIEKDEVSKKAIIKLSDRLTKVNNDAALKFADNIIQEYIKKTKIKKFNISIGKRHKKDNNSKMNIDLMLRDKINENYLRLRRMVFLYDKTKKELEFAGNFELKKKGLKKKGLKKN